MAKKQNQKKKEDNKNKKIIRLVLSVIGVIIIVYVLYNFYIEVKATINNQIEKPIIYIYPEEKMNVSIKVSNPELFTTVYPKYNNGWEVIANTDGSLIDKKTGNKLYSLYYEANRKDINKIDKEGFVVKGEDISSFLEEKLDILGLNYKEKEEFIVYWLPKLEHNKYNYIRFETIDEINNNMELFIEPSPDTLIRIMMEYKGLDKEIEIREQALDPVNRVGFTVVEWGGTEIK